MAENHLSMGSPGDYSSSSFLQGSTDSSGFITNQKNKDSVRMAALQNEWNKQAVESDRAYNEWYYKQYASPEALMRQYKEAGLNPYGVFGQSFNGSSGQTSSQQVGDIAAASQASATNRQADIAEKQFKLGKVQSTLNLIGTAADKMNENLSRQSERALMASQADVQKAQASYIRAQATAQNMENQRLALRNGWYDRPYMDVRNYKPESGATVGEVNSYFSALGDAIPGMNEASYPSNTPNDFQGMAIRGALGFANGMYSSEDIKNMSYQAMRSMELQNDSIAQGIAESQQKVEVLKTEAKLNLRTWEKIGSEMSVLASQKELNEANTRKIIDREMPLLSEEKKNEYQKYLLNFYAVTEAKVRSKIWSQVHVRQTDPSKPYSFVGVDGKEHQSTFTRQWLELYQGTPYLHGSGSESSSYGFGNSYFHQNIGETRSISY